MEAQDLGFVWGPFQRGSGDFRAKRSTRQETVYYCLKCFIEGRNSEITLSGSAFLFQRKSVLGSKINAGRSEPLGVFGKISTSPGRR